MLVFIGKLSLSTLRLVPIYHGFSHFSRFLHHFVLAQVATSSIRVKVWLVSQGNFIECLNTGQYGLSHEPTSLSFGLEVTDKFITCPARHSLSQNLETGCTNEGFIDFWVSKVWYKVHTTNEINHIYLHMLPF